MRGLRIAAVVRRLAWPLMGTVLSWATEVQGAEALYDPPALHHHPPLRLAATVPASTVPGATGFCQDAAPPLTLGVAKGRRADMRRWNRPGGQASGTLRITTPCRDWRPPAGHEEVIRWEDRGPPAGRNPLWRREASRPQDPRNRRQHRESRRGEDLQEASRGKRARESQSKRGKRPHIKTTCDFDEPYPQQRWGFRITTSGSRRCRAWHHRKRREPTVAHHAGEPTPRTCGNVVRPQVMRRRRSP